jgi:hypothetical protein
LFISASIERGTCWVALEGNSARSRDRVCRQVERFLMQLADAGAFAGHEYNRHYFVICDERLNGLLSRRTANSRLVYGYRSRRTAQRASRGWWCIAPAAPDRPVSLNQLAIARSVGRAAGRIGAWPKPATSFSPMV